MNELILQIVNYIRSAWRFRWYAILVAWLVALAGWAYIFVMPDKYESNAKIYVDTDSILRPLLEGLAVQTDINQRLHLMSRMLLSQSNLEKVLRETDLDHKAETPQDIQKLVEWLRETIVIDASHRRIGGSSQQENFYTISYTYNDPVKAYEIVQTLLNLFMEQALGDTRVETETAQRFLEQQIREYEARLIEAENRLTEFRRKNIDTLPSQSGGVFNELQTTRNELQAIQLELKEAQIRRDELRRQFQRTQAEEDERRRAGRFNAETPLGRRIEAMQTRLDELLLRYTEVHPDVQELKGSIEELKAQEAKAPVVEIRSSPSVATSALEELKLAYRQAEVELTTIRIRKREYENRVSVLREKLDTLPKVEAELARLNRDYDVNRENYQQLVQRLESARMSEQADTAGDSVKFRIVEPPKVPLLPAGPKRVLLSAAILILSLGAGAALAFLISQLKPVFYDVTTLRKETEYPVFGQVSRVWTPGLKVARKIEVSGFTTATVLLVLAFAAVIALYMLGLREEILGQLKQVVMVLKDYIDRP